jgi:hypothetical protein
MPNNEDDEKHRLRFRPGQPVEKDAEGNEAGELAGPGSDTAAPSSSGGSGDHIDPKLRGGNPVAQGTERADAAENVPDDNGPQATPATS